MGLVTSGAVVPYDVYTNYAFNLTRIYDDRVALMHPSVFLQRFARVWDGNAGRLVPLVLEPWQVFLVDDPSGQAVYLKPRQVGVSFLRAARGLAKALIQRNYTAVFVSYNRDEAKNKIIYAKNLYETMEYRGKPEIKRDNAAELGWDNGSRMISLPAKAVRGYANPDVFIDEGAFVPKCGEIFSGTLSSGVRGGGTLAMGSTPFGTANFFHDVYADERGVYPSFVRHRIEWWYSPAMCSDVGRALIEAPLMETADRVARFGSAKLKEIFSGLPLADFQREHECSFDAKTGEVIPRDVLLQACEWPEDDDGQPDIERLDCVVRAWRGLTVAQLEQEALPALSRALRAMHPRSTFACGYDVGRTQDGAQLVVVEERPDGDRITRAFIRLHDTKYEVQQLLLISLLKDRRHRRTHIDATGIGGPLAEYVRSRFVSDDKAPDEGSVIAVNFGGSGQRAQVFAAVKDAVEGRYVLVYPHADLFKHFAAWKWVDDSGEYADKFTLKRGKNDDATGHHGEIVVALGLALFEIAGRKPKLDPVAVRAGEAGQSPPRGAARRRTLYTERTPGGGFVRHSPGGLFVPATM